MATHRKKQPKPWALANQQCRSGRKILMTCLGLISDLGYFVFVNMFMNIGKQAKSDISPQGSFWV